MSSCEGRYSISVAGSGACGEARDGACVGRVEENKTGRTSARMIRAGVGDTCPKVDNDSSQETGKCKNTKCDVTIGGNSYCSQCSKPSDHLVDGKCVATGGDTGCTSQDVPNGTCKSCGDGYFMYQGGCYSVDASKPGHALCTTAPAGVCTAAAAGYFIPPGATKTDQSVVACGDATTGVTVDTNKKYVGVDGCSKCSAPQTIQEPNGGTVVATCSECSNSKIVKTDNGVTSCVTDDECTGTEGFFVKDGTPKTCEACGDENCATCAAEGTGQCNKCKTTGTKTYLKVSAGAGTCVEASQCGPTAFPKDDSANGNKCASCSSASDGGIENCAECSLLPSASRSSTVLITCTKCTANKLSPLGDACLTACPAGIYDDNSICKPCHVSCAECNSNANQDSCTACYPGHVLNRTTDSSNTDTCIPECTGRYAENCEAGMCTAELGGSKYCSRCKSGFVPVDGLCVSATARAPTGCTPGEGVCSSCTRTYFLQSGGCYNTQALPGMAVCTTANGGPCSQCANGQTAASSNCPACAEGCSACNAGQTQQCTACLAGYYLSNSKCFKCTADSNEGSNAVTNISNCVNCAPSSVNHKLITCCPKIDSCTIDTRGDGVDKNIFSTSVVTSVFVLPAFSICGLAEFLVSDRPIAIAGRYLLEETDPSTVYKPASLCDVST